MAAVDNAQRPSQFLDKEDRALMAAHPEVAKKPTRGYTTAAEKKYNRAPRLQRPPSEHSWYRWAPPPRLAALETPPPPPTWH